MNGKGVYQYGDWTRELRQKEKSLMKREGMEDKYIYIEDCDEEGSPTEIVAVLDGYFTSKQLKAITDLVDEADELFINKVDFISKEK